MCRYATNELTGEAWRHWKVQPAHWANVSTDGLGGCWQTEEGGHGKVANGYTRGQHKFAFIRTGNHQYADIPVNISIMQV